MMKIGSKLREIFFISLFLILNRNYKKIYLWDIFFTKFICQGVFKEINKNTIRDKDKNGEKHLNIIRNFEVA